MTTDTTYNGWTNRSTWLVNLHLSNDHATYLTVRDTVASMLPYAWLQSRALWSESRNPGVSDDARSELVESGAHSRIADELQGFAESLVVVDDATDDVASLLANDLLGTALAVVDWREVAGGWIDDANESPDAYDVECDGCGDTVDARTCVVDSATADPYCNECDDE